VPFVFVASQQQFNLDDKLNIAVTQIGDGTAAGLKVTMMGRQPATAVVQSGGGGGGIGAPVVSSISPNTGPLAGGTSVTISGSNFTGATAVTFGSQPATNVMVVNANTITATTPAGTVGAANVSVTTPAGTGVGSNLFSYISSGGQFGVPRKIGTASPGSNQSSTSFTTIAALADGDLLVVAATALVGGSSGKFISMNINGTALTPRKQSLCSSGGDAGFAEIWELFCPSAFPIGATITVSASGTSVGGIAVAAGAITGPTAFDVGNVANSNGTATQNVPVSTGTLSTQPEVVVGVIGSNLAGSFSHNNDVFGASVIADLSGSPYISLELAMLVVTATQSVTYNPTTSGSGAYIESAVAAYR
jgi:hypothetical protein